MGIIIGAVGVGLFLILLLWAVAIYNGLIAKRVGCNNGWSQIDVQLRRRHDLIPNLVETVKGYAGHEAQTLEAVISARARAVAVTSDSAHAQEKSLAENMLTQALGRLIAVAEAYPDLKANANFASLQEELASTENRIGFARQHYNDSVSTYEVARTQFPAVIVAGAFGFKPGAFYNDDNAAIKETPRVSFS